MTSRQLIGYAILASPFVAIFILSTVLHGILPTIGIFAGVAIVVALVFVGAEMVI